jgi:replicative DNA helicase
MAFEDNRYENQSIYIPGTEREIQTGYGKVPPQAIEIEMAVLGAMLIDRDASLKVFDILIDECFYKEAHRKIFKAMIVLFERGEPIDIITLSSELKRRENIESIGGAFYLTELTSRVTSSANIEFHSRLLLDKYILRQVIIEGSKIVEKCFSEKREAFELLDEFQASIFNLLENNMKKGFVDIKSAITKTLEEVEEVHGRMIGVTGVPSGYIELDKITGGFQKSDLIIIAGRPGQGKTALALNIARNAAVDFDIPVGVFSLEMSINQLVLRLMCSEAYVDLHDIRTGQLSPQKWQLLSTRVGVLAAAKMFIDDTPALSILELRAKARRLKLEHDIGLIIVDYLQLMQGPRSAESREREISNISNNLKSLAKELDIPIIALSQLNRQVESRGDKRPQLSDLRESGSIEQDADMVIFIHRPESYGITEYSGNKESTENKADVIIGKQRNGPTGEIKLYFNKRYTRFENITRREIEEPPDVSSAYELPEGQPF